MHYRFVFCNAIPKIGCKDRLCFTLFQKTSVGIADNLFYFTITLDGTAEVNMRIPPLKHTTRSPTLATTATNNCYAVLLAILRRSGHRRCMIHLSRVAAPFVSAHSRQTCLLLSCLFIAKSSSRTFRDAKIVLFVDKCK